MAGTNVEETMNIKLFLLGGKGVGKSATGNTILGRQAFTSRKSSIPVTQEVVEEFGIVNQIPVAVYDTPGISDTDLSKDDILKYQEVFQKCESGLCVFFLVIKADIFSIKERNAVENIQKLLGEKHLQNTWILFTGGDELEEEKMTTEEFINKTESLKELIHKHNDQYHMFNNKTKGPHEEVKILLSRILMWRFKTVSDGSNLRIPVNIHNIPDDSRLSRRIVLLGKSGVGKSATGNTILQQPAFKSALSTVSETKTCSLGCTTAAGRNVSVVDTPGFFDTCTNTEELTTEIAKCVYMSSPGAHAFLIVFPLQRFTCQEEQIPQMIETLFGKDVLKYSIIVFTYGDKIEKEPIETLINKNRALRSLVQQCGGRYHVFNNIDQNNSEQVNDLLQKIDTMIEQNGGGYYTNGMLQEAERCKREDDEQKQGETNKEKQEMIERVKKEVEEEIIAKLQASSGFDQFFSKNKKYFYMAACLIGVLSGGAAVAFGGSISCIGVVSGTVVCSGTVSGALGGTFLGATTCLIGTGMFDLLLYLKNY